MRPKRSHGSEGRQWRRQVSQIVQRDKGKCWICGHWGAYSADHVVPDTEGGTSDPSNLKAAHGYPRPCLVCSKAAGHPVYCNEIRGMGTVERARRIIEERTGLSLGDAGPSRPEGREL